MLADATHDLSHLADSAFRSQRQLAEFFDSLLTQSYHGKIT